MAGNQGLDDALADLITTPASSESSADTVLSRIEARLGGEAPLGEKEETTEEPEATEEESEDSTEAEETEEPDEDETEDAEDTEEATEDDEDKIELSEDQLAAALGLPEGSAKVDDEGNTLIRTKVDGKVDYVPLKDITASYQMEKHWQERIRTTAEDKKQFDTQKEQESQKLQNAIGDAIALSQSLEKQMFSQYQGVDFNALKAQDPGRWAAMQQEIQQRQQYINNIKGQLGNTIRSQQEEFNQKSEEQKKARVLEGAEKLIDAIPTWSDPDTATKEIQALVPIAIAAGYTEEEFIGAEDYRLILLVREASKAKKEQETTSIVKKRLKSIPKITKPGSKKVNSKSKEDRERSHLTNNLKRTGSTADAAAALLSRL